MIRDAYDLEDQSELSADLLVIGGGLAGLALAREFAGRGPSVIVLESGGLEPEPETQALYGGSARIEDGAGGTVDLGGFLGESRLRCLGGSGNIWGAKCALLDESDFQAREWIADSGWPFTRAELMPFYDRACERLGIARFDYDPTQEFDPGRPPLALAGNERFTTATRHLSPVRGGRPGSPSPALEQYLAAVTGAANVQVLLHANALEIECDESASAARAVRVGTLRGTRLRVTARAIVLATGGTENARLLLASRSVRSRGLGNEHDLVGRYFSNHATFGPGSALGFTRAPAELDLYTTRDVQKKWGVLALSGAAQRAERLPNFTVTMGPSEGAPDAEDLDLVAAAALADDGYAVGERAARAPVPAYFMSEQLLNPESRVTLTDERDALGLPRVRLDWRFRAEDAAHLRRSLRLFGRELGRTGTGRVRCEWPEGSPMALYSPSRHHLGTTRMHRDPTRGVVDADARVHGVARLYVAGSSVFPTPGIANPTLTLIALALRLADHLRAELGV